MGPAQSDERGVNIWPLSTLPSRIRWIPNSRYLPLYSGIYTWRIARQSRKATFSTEGFSRFLGERLSQGLNRLLKKQVSEA
jgi:hypothetical protein